MEGREWEKERDDEQHITRPTEIVRMPGEVPHVTVAPSATVGLEVLEVELDLVCHGLDHESAAR